jgi:hypothetical protein
MNHHECYNMQYFLLSYNTDCQVWTCDKYNWTCHDNAVNKKEWPCNTIMCYATPNINCWGVLHVLVHLMGSFLSPDGTLMFVYVVQVICVFPHFQFPSVVKPASWITLLGGQSLSYVWQNLHCPVNNEFSYCSWKGITRVHAEENFRVVGCIADYPISIYLSS